MVTTLWLLIKVSMMKMNEWGFYFRNLTVALHTGVTNITALGPGAAAITETPVDAVDHSYGPLRVTPMDHSVSHH